MAMIAISATNSQMNTPIAPAATPMVILTKFGELGNFFSTRPTQNVASQNAVHATASSIQRASIETLRTPDIAPITILLLL